MHLDFSTNRLKGILLASLLFLGTIVLLACGDTASETGSQPSAQTGSQAGTLSVLLTDNAGCGFDQVNVTVSKVRVHQSASAKDGDSGWSEIVLSPPKKINLISLMNGVLEELGTAPLTAGHYTQLRLVLLPNGNGETNNSVVLSGETTEIPIKVPSGAQSGIKLIHQFDVAAGDLVELVLDFDACKSIVRKGNQTFSLKPVISVTPMLVGGRISGVLDLTYTVDQNQPPVQLSHAMIYAEQGGHVVKSTVPNADGSFVLSPLVQSSTAGDYDVVITGDIVTSTSTIQTTTAMIHSVPVVAGGTTTVSDTANPIELNLSSSIHSVSGTVQPVEAGATIRALQTFSSGETMEVRSVNADLSDGSYSMTLPVDAPSLGDYGDGTLPITLVPDASIAGIYDLEVSAEGYLTQTAPGIDISGGDVLNQDFTLPAAP